MRMAPRALVVLIAIDVVAGCGQAPSASPAAVGTATIALRTQPPQPPGTAQACMAALTTGTVIRDDQSGLALRDPQGLVRQVIWPNGYSTRDDSGRRALLDASGDVVAHEGDRVSIGGGEIDPKPTWLACPGTIALAP